MSTTLNLDSTTRYACQVLNRSYAQPHMGIFFGAVRDEALTLAHEAIIQQGGDFTDQQFFDASTAWAHDAPDFEIDEDGYSLVFFAINLAQ